MDRKALGPILTTSQLSEIRALLRQLERSGSLLELAKSSVVSLLREIDVENEGTTVLIESPRIDDTGDIAIPDEVVDLKLLLDCRRERDEALAEVERLRKSVEDWHDACVRAERNAAMSQEESMLHLDRIAELEAKVERLQKCCTQRGARMQIMREWLDSNRGLGPPTEWWYFCEERPSAKKWFDADGVPVNTPETNGETI